MFCHDAARKHALPACRRACVSIAQRYRADRPPGRRRNEHPPPQHPQARPPSNVLNSKGIEESAAKRFARDFFRPGDAVNEDALRRDFHALWNTQYFEDIRLEIEDSADKPNQKIIVYYLTERPIVRRIQYKGNKSISESTFWIDSRTARWGLSIESQFDPTRIKKAEVVLKELLAEHGRQYATVKPTFERLPGTNAITLTFNINEGPKVKVGKIIITGNTAFSANKIIRTMRNSKPYADSSRPVPPYFIPVLSKTFDRPKLDEDMEIGIRGLYQDNGYFKVLVKDPIIQNITMYNGRNRAAQIRSTGCGHQGRETNITIPIEEGERYHMGTFLVMRNANPDEGICSSRPPFWKAPFP